MITSIQLLYLQWFPRGVQRVWMSSLCVKGTVCFHVLVNDLVIRVFPTDTVARLCICTSGCVARSAMHWIGWKKFKQPGQVYMILGAHCSSLWYVLWLYARMILFLCTTLLDHFMCFVLWEKWRIKDEQSYINRTIPTWIYLHLHSKIKWWHGLKLCVDIIVTINMISWIMRIVNNSDTYP